MKHLGYTFLFCIILFGTWTGPAEAVPVAGDYILSSTFVNGTFTSTGTSLALWQFEDSWSLNTWSGPTPLAPTGSSVLVNDSNTFRQYILPQLPQLYLFWAPPNSDFNSFCLHGCIGVQKGDYSFSGYGSFEVNPVPEPSAVILVSTGLLGIAGYQWSQRRREGLQVG